jgi:hypothetical protein
VIGIYEPVVLVYSDQLRETSLAAQPELIGAPEPVYHRGCGEGCGGAIGASSDRSTAQSR